MGRVVRHAPRERVSEISPLPLLFAVLQRPDSGIILA
jgi:hypothetical protein